MRRLVYVALSITVLACTESPRTSRGGRSSGNDRQTSDASTAMPAQDGALSVDAQTNPGLDGGTSLPDASMMGSSDAGSVPPTTTGICVKSCVQVMDCEIQNELYGSDNYSCTANACIWTGCNNDAECQAGFQDSSYICDLSTEVPSCIKTCTSPNDCTIAGSSLFDADNYDCKQSRCNWTGCNLDSECQEAYQDSAYLCVPIPGSTNKTCMKSCRTTNDCIQAGSTLTDGDNYRCANNYCQYTGCNSDMECAEAYQSTDYVCVVN